MKKVFALSLFILSAAAMKNEEKLISEIRRLTIKSDENKTAPAEAREKGFGIEESYAYQCRQLTQNMLYQIRMGRRPSF